MSLNKPLNQIQLSRWLNEKFRDELLIKSPYDKQAHSQILSLIENNGNGGRAITKQLEEILAAVGKERNYAPLNKDMLREELKFFMAEKDLTIKDVAGLIKKNPETIWRFLNKKVKPHDGTVYKIKNLLRRSE